MADLSRLKRQRGHIQATVTMLKKCLDQAELEPSRRNRFYIQSTLDSAIKAFNNFEHIQDNLEELDEDEIENRLTYIESYNTEKSRALELLDSLNPPIEPMNTSTNNTILQEATKAAVTLPTIPLPTFDGTPEKWAAFFSLFSTLIDQENLPPVKKLNYLRVSLTGKAAKVIESLELTDGNYDIALSLLKDKFENLQRMTRRHMSILREFPKLQKDTPSAISELVDTFYQHIRALENLKAPVSFWDIPLVDLILSKVSSNTVWQWELTQDSNNVPSYKELLKFLNKRADCADFSRSENTNNKSVKLSQEYSHRKESSRVYSQALYTHSNNHLDSSNRKSIDTRSIICPVCHESHLLYTCDNFRNLSVEDRSKVISNAHLCFNCFGKGHNAISCKSQTSCRKCFKRHNTLLHPAQINSAKTSAEPNRATTSSAVSQTKQTTLVLNSMSNDIMVTAVLNIFNQHQELIQCRGLLDTCSTTNFITKRLADTLNIKTTTCNIPIGALNSMTTYCKELAVATIKSRINAYKKTLTFMVVPSISNLVPDQSIQRDHIKIPYNIKLADPNFHQPAPVDLLLGAGTTLSVLSVGQLKIATDTQEELYLQKTLLGWIIGGAIPANKTSRFNCHTTAAPTEFDLQKFWKIEECPPIKKFTKEEEECEQHFRENVRRDPTGRYVVALPFNPLKPQLGTSYHFAVKRFEGIERRLIKNPDLKIQYNEVLMDYLLQQHMSPVRNDSTLTTNYYLPHHAVKKESSLTTKLRVVFDGSLKTSTGVSLNDVLFTGPTIQPELFSILIRFRKHPIVITGDLKQMYRQFLVRKSDRKFQRILWRNQDKQMQTYELNTITFGITCAPYLAIRCLHQLAADEAKSYPVVAPLLQSEFYVDDFLSGAKTTQEAKFIINQMTKLLATAGLTMRQWASNNPSVLTDIPADDINGKLQLGDSTLKTLGIYWESKSDTITYTVSPIELTPITKRTILSAIAKIFDPLGLLAPVIILAKIILQKLWTHNLDWDESLPAALHTEWLTYCRQLPSLNQLSFSRTIISTNIQEIQLHGFADASENAYGACIYIRATDLCGSVKVQLLCAKSRVAPIKTTTIPRLELCGAQLLATLMKNVHIALQEKTTMYYWTDSTIVLHWLRACPQQLKTFVAHRVADIQEKTNIQQWRHVPTQHNPADLVSRGVFPNDFLSASMWQNGPIWLKHPSSKWPSIEIAHVKEIPEQRRTTCLVSVIKPFTTLTRFSTLNKMLRSLAYCFRFIHPKTGPLQVTELTHVENSVIKCIQKQVYHEELKILSNSQSGKKMSSALMKLNPFLDKEGIMRVGGRLALANLPFDAKHPIILPKKNHVTDLFILHVHRRHLHPGVQQTLYLLRRKYWIVDGRSQVYKVIKKCVDCFKACPPPTKYIMGKLPKARVNPSRPFDQVGVDYCGPFLVKEKRFRNKTSIKSYVVVFVCFAVKAVHLELVTDLTTDNFLAALRRFVSRRGLCKDIYSDNGTNFVGANRSLKEFINHINSSESQAQIQGFLTEKGIQWHFSPPRAPHVGGLWEAAVKSFKKHLYHVAGRDLLFTYEQFNTLIIEIEAILNSRPLTSMSSDPTDPIALTPGHFLIGDSLTNLRSHDYSSVPFNRLSCYGHVAKVRQHFWNRWSSEYLNELTVRIKWEHPGPEITTGAVVVLREDNLPPAHWALGKIVECYPGSDGVVRTVLVKTSKCSVIRNVKKLAVLPIEL